MEQLLGPQRRRAARCDRSSRRRAPVAVRRDASTRDPCDGAPARAGRRRARLATLVAARPSARRARVARRTSAGAIGPRALRSARRTSDRRTRPLAVPGRREAARRGRFGRGAPPSSRSPTSLAVGAVGTTAPALRRERDRDGRLLARRADQRDRLTSQVERRGDLARDDREHLDAVDPRLDLGAEHLTDLHATTARVDASSVPRGSRAPAARQVYRPSSSLLVSSMSMRRATAAKLSRSGKNFMSAGSPPSGNPTIAQPAGVERLRGRRGSRRSEWASSPARTPTLMRDAPTVQVPRRRRRRDAARRHGATRSPRRPTQPSSRHIRRAAVDSAFATRGARARPGVADRRAARGRSPRPPGARCARSRRPRLRGSSSRSSPRSSARSSAPASCGPPRARTGRRPSRSSRAVASPAPRSCRGRVDPAAREGGLAVVVSVNVTTGRTRRTRGPG